MSESFGAGFLSNRIFTQSQRVIPQIIYYLKGGKIFYHEKGLQVFLNEKIILHIMNSERIGHHGFPGRIEYEEYDFTYELLSSRIVSFNLIKTFSFAI